jgi:hypothetical protein
LEQPYALRLTPLRGAVDDPDERQVEHDQCGQTNEEGSDEIQESRAGS